MKIRKLIESDIQEAMNLVLAEGWNQTEKDWEFLLQNPDNKCLSAESDGKLIGTATAAVYSGKLAWIGMVLVNKNFRRQGIGKLLLKSILQELNHIQSVKLDATPAGQAVYKNLGFNEEHRILRMVRKPSAFHLEFDTEKFIRNLAEEKIPALVKFDAETFGVARNELIGYLHLKTAVNSLQAIHHNEISGSLLGREGNRYTHIGPVSAVSPEIATGLVAKTLKDVHHKPVVVDVLEDKKELIGWLQSVGFEIQRPFIRMFYPKNPFPGIPENQYLICGPEFG